MEAGSLLQEALLRQADQQDVLHSQHALHIDIYALPDNSSSSSSSSRPSTSTATNNDNNNDDQIQHLMQLSQLAREANAFFQSKSHYDWHIGGDGPVFGIHASDGIPHLRAICRYGANVADEWAAVNLALAFSKTTTAAVVECWDVQDGQLLLIESADILPPWVDRVGPEACRHRCWIRQGVIHLIAPSGKAKESGDCSLALHESLAIWGQEKGATRSGNFIETPEEVQTAIHDCIARFLSQSSGDDNTSNHHKAALAVPRSVACLIQQRPDLVNAAIVAFANHALNPSKPKAKSNCNNSNSTTTSVICEDWVWTTHSFSRTNFAMLRTIVSPTWKTETYIPKEYQSVELRRAQRQGAVEATPHLRHAVQIGVRLVVGLNSILQQQAKASLLSSIQERRVLHYWPRLLQEDLNSSAQWLIEAWKAGPNHAPYNLEDILKCPVVTEELELAPDSISTLSHPDTSLPEQIRKELRTSESSHHNFILPRQSEVDSNEDWMMLSSDTVEDQMKSMRGDDGKREKIKTFPSAQKSQEQKDKEDAAQLDTMLHGFQTFIGDKSDVEGVSHPKNLNAPTANVNANNKTAPAKHGININPRVFLHLLKTVLDPSTSPETIKFPPASRRGEETNEDDFFSRDDYEAMLPEGDDEEDMLPMDTDVVELMAAMDAELKGTAAAASSGDQVADDDEDDEAAQKARILTNLLQSLDAGAGGPGPVQSMMKAMGAEPPLFSPGGDLDDETDDDDNE